MKSSKGIYYRNGIAYIRYQNEKGELFRESTQQADRRVAERILVKRRSQVAMLHHFPSRSFESVKFGSLLEEWWERQGKSKRSCYRYLIDAVREPFGNLRARDIRPMDIERFLDELSATGKSNAYLNVHRTVISNAFSFAIKNKLFDDNPTRAVPTRRENRRERFASPEEFRRLIAGSSEDPELEAFIYLAAMTAMRKSEILERRWDEVFLNAELPYLRVPITKNGPKAFRSQTRLWNHSNGFRAMARRSTCSQRLPRTASLETSRRHTVGIWARSSDGFAKSWESKTCVFTTCGTQARPFFSPPAFPKRSSQSLPGIAATKCATTNT